MNLKKEIREIKEKLSGGNLLKYTSKLLSTAETLPETISEFMEIVKKNKIKIVVGEDTKEKKKENNNLEILMLLLLSISITVFITIGGNLNIFDHGITSKNIVTLILLFPLIFTILYLILRKKLNS